VSFAAAEARATAACLSTRGIGHDVIYRPLSGSPVETTAIIEDERVTAGDPDLTVIETRTMMRVLLTIAPRFTRGDEVEQLVLDVDGAVIGSRVWQVEMEARRDNLLAHLVVMPK